MTDRERELINRYVYEVTKRVPKEQRDEIELEMRELIGDMLEELTLDQVFAKLGWDGLAKTLWLGNPKIALYSVAFVDNWHWWGFIMVLFLGALQQVDSELYEAARVDGANRFQELLHVSIPGIRPTIAFVLIMTIMWSFLTFDYVYIMTNGGPANATEIMSTYIYKNAFTKYRAGYANALCVIQCGICIILYFVQKVISEKGGIENG